MSSLLVATGCSLAPPSLVQRAARDRRRRRGRSTERARSRGSSSPPTVSVPARHRCSRPALRRRPPLPHLPLHLLGQLRLLLHRRHLRPHHRYWPHRPPSAHLCRPRRASPQLRRRLGSLSSSKAGAALQAAHSLTSIVACAHRFLSRESARRRDARRARCQTSGPVRQMARLRHWAELGSDVGALTALLRVSRQGVHVLPNQSND